MGQAMKVARLAVALAVVLALTACGKRQAPVETARPVLVVHPSGGAQAAFTAYAGEIRAREESALSFRIAGSLVKRLVDAGDRVRRGQLLAELDPDDADAKARVAQAQLAAADAELARTSADRARYATLEQQKLVSRSLLDAQDTAHAAAAGQVRAARAQLDVARNQVAYTRLQAPRDGVIANRLAEAGQTVSAGQTVYSLAGDGGREVAIALPETRFREVRVGQPVMVELWSAPGQRLPGRVREISPAADPQARTYAARIALEGEALAAVDLGQSARVYMQQSGERAALGVPLSAVQRSADGKTHSLWLVDPATRRVRLVSVQLGTYGEDSVPVLAGVAADAWVVAAGGHLLREGQLVAPVDRDNRPVPGIAAPAAAAK